MPGVLAGAIDYYIFDKFQRLTNTKAYTKVCSIGDLGTLELAFFSVIVAC